LLAERANAFHDFHLHAPDAEVSRLWDALRVGTQVLLLHEPVWKRRAAQIKFRALVDLDEVGG
ncbi:MAG: hypothetical protein LQ346_009132, partial [Caloplaca aetnensis]